ncbi:MAG: pyridoxal 5'-phosphate synthase glutaminase subunit PdxT [Candidatus Dormibacteria bacterium]
MGVLALQGAFREHIEILRRLGIEAFPMRTAEELAQADAVVLPGGESTTMDKLLRKFELQEPLRDRLRAGMPALATCAGLILLARDVIDGLPDQQSLGVLPIATRRNGYGRQPDSFEREVRVAGLDSPFPGVFIRAPVIDAMDEGVEVLAEVDGNAVAVAVGPVMGLTFHPELTQDGRLHRLFVERAAAAAPGSPVAEVSRA